MKALDAMRVPDGDEQKVRFDQIRIGELFIHKTRVLVRTPDLYRLDGGCPPTLTKTNAVRLADLDNQVESKRIAGQPSTFCNDTYVISRPDAVAYLKG